MVYTSSPSPPPGLCGARGPDAGWGRAGGPVLGEGVGIIISDQPLDVSKLFMQIVISLLFSLEVMILLSGLVLLQDPGSYSLEGRKKV